MFVKKKIAAGIMAALCLASLASAASADDKSEPVGARTVVTVGSETLNEREMVQVLQNKMQGNVMMVGIMLTQSSMSDRIGMTNQIADMVVLAEGARLDGMDKREDVAFALKWQRIQTLADAYLAERSQHWDLSEKALKAYYAEHKDEFVQAEAAHVRHILTASESEARDAILDIYRDKDFAKTAEKFSRDTQTAQKGGDLGWVEKGTLPETLAAAVEKSQLKSLSAPVPTNLGWHVFEVLERRPAKQLTFDEAREDVEQRLQVSYIDEDIAALREKLKVEVNEETLENLAGIPAAPEEDVKKDTADEKTAPAKEEADAAESSEENKPQ